MQPMVRPMHQAKHGEGADEIRHAVRAGAVALHGDARDDSHSENWLPGSASLRALCGPISVPRIHAPAQRCAEQGALSLNFGQSSAQGRAVPVSARTHQGVPQGIPGENSGVQQSADFGEGSHNRSEVA
mgnify:CR=1 FL=1